MKPSCGRRRVRCVFCLFEQNSSGFWTTLLVPSKMPPRFSLAAHVRLLTTAATQPRLLTILSSNVPRLPTTLSSTLLLLVPMLPPLLTTYGISTRRCYRPHTHTHKHRGRRPASVYLLLSYTGKASIGSLLLHLVILVVATAGKGNRKAQHTHSYWVPRR